MQLHIYCYVLPYQFISNTAQYTDTVCHTVAVPQAGDPAGAFQHDEDRVDAVPLAESRALYADAGPCCADTVPGCAGVSHAGDHGEADTHAGDHDPHSENPAFADHAGVVLHTVDCA